MKTNEKIIEVKNFSKNFGTKQVVKNLSFDVFKGEIFAFLGANGSGKTTTLRSLLNIYSHDSGELLISGNKFTPQMSNKIGYLPEERGLYTNSKVIETMIYFGQLKGLSSKVAKNNALQYLEMVELADKAKVDIKKLSSGQQQKIQLGITILNKPELLILDEPTKGLDPVNREIFTNIFLDLNKNGTTIIFSTHQMEEAEKIADRLIMIKNGERALYGEVNEVKKQFGDDNIKISFKGALEKENRFYSAKVNGNTALLSPKDSVDQNSIIMSLLKQKIEIIKLEQSNPSLQEIFVKVSQDN
jgi:ABC-2 type transport system ATP-binding protein